MLKIGWKTCLTIDLVVYVYERQLERWKEYVAVMSAKREAVQFAYLAFIAHLMCMAVCYRNAICSLSEVGTQSCTSCHLLLHAHMARIAELDGESRRQWRKQKVAKDQAGEVIVLKLGQGRVTIQLVSLNMLVVEATSSWTARQMERCWVDGRRGRCQACREKKVWAAWDRSRAVVMKPCQRWVILGSTLSDEPAVEIVSSCAGWRIAERDAWIDGLIWSRIKSGSI